MKSALAPTLALFFVALIGCGGSGTTDSGPLFVAKLATDQGASQNALTAQKIAADAGGSWVKNYNASAFFELRVTNAEFRELRTDARLEGIDRYDQMREWTCVVAGSPTQDQTQAAADAICDGSKIILVNVYSDGTFDADMTGDTAAKLASDSRLSDVDFYFGGGA